MYKKKMQLRKYFIKIFIVLALFSISYTITSLYILYSLNKNALPDSKNLPDAFDDVPFHLSCYFETETPQHLSPVNESPKPENSIFFHETSCQWTLQIREACSVESAARAHPNRQVYVVFSRSFPESDCESGVLNALATIYKPNIHYHTVNLSTYAQGTPLQHVFPPRLPYWLGKWHDRKIRELLKFLTLYKFGGTVVDLDVMVVGSLDSLGGDWASRVGEEVKSGIISLSRGLTGKFYAEKFLETLKHQIAYDGVTRAESALEDALKSLCNTSEVSKMNRETCKGFRIYSKEFLKPVNWGIKATNISGTYLAYHLWHEAMWDHRSSMANDSLYASLAKEHCPLVYRSFMAVFSGRPNRIYL